MVEDVVHRRLRKISRRHTLIAAFVAVFLGMGCVPSLADPVAPAATRSGSCPSIILYFSRGSGQKDTNTTAGIGQPGYAVYQALLTAFKGKGVNVGEMANAYPAVSVNLLKQLTLSYRRSVKLGIGSAHRNLADLIALCPRSQIVLGGFSQGAQVTRGALEGLTDPQRDHIAAAVLFGDPLFDPEEAASGPQRPTSTDVLAYNGKRHGILRRFFESPIDPVFAGRVFSWCHGRDLVCQGRVHRFKYHSEYALDAVDAARAIVAVLAERGIPAKSSTPPVTYPYKIVTGSCHAPACGLARFRGPGTTAFSVAGTLVNRERVAIVCQTTGETLHGLNGRTSAIWDRLADGTFVPDFYVNTTGIGHRTSGIRGCAKLTHTA
jgi:hypothetical protein